MRTSETSFHAHRTKKSETLLAALNTCREGAWRSVGGIPLVVRCLYLLREAAVRKVFLLVPEGNPRPDLTSWNRWIGDVKVENHVVRDSIARSIRAATGGEHDLLYLDAAHLIDARLVISLSRASATTCAFMSSTDRTTEVIRAALVRHEDLREWVAQGDGFLIGTGRLLLPDDLDSFRPDVRGSVPPYFLEVDSAADAREATRFLIRRQQNQVMDFPAQYLDPPFENALTMFLCNTPVTPNMVTGCCLAVALGVTWLFWHGYFVAGALGTFVVEILDGVDGKLARTKLLFSKLGRHEDLIDYFYETSWYVALGVGLRHAAQSTLAPTLAAVLIVSDTIDNILYTLAQKWYGKSIDLFSPFDAAFRKIAGRRNIYGWMFIIGFLIGYPMVTFAAAAGWAALTAAIHGTRLAQFQNSVKRFHEQGPGSLS